MTPLSHPHLALEVDGSLAVLRLDDPASGNAFTPDMVEAFIATVDEFGASESPVRAVVITGTGKAFCYGNNLKNMQRRGPSGQLAETLYNPMTRRLRDAPFPIVAAVNGGCVGMAVTMALMADTVIAGRSAYFLLPFVQNLASVGDLGITWLLPRLIGLSRARRMLLYSERVPAETALDWGLVDAVYDDGDLDREARALGRRLADGPTFALASLRRTLWAAMDNSYERQLDAEVTLGREIMATADFNEAVNAFVEKRPPRFTGR